MKNNKSIKIQIGGHKKPRLFCTKAGAGCHAGINPANLNMIASLSSDSFACFLNGLAELVVDRLECFGCDLDR